MRKIVYKDLNTLLDMYLQNFKVAEMQKSWNELRQTYPVLTFFPISIEEILTAPYASLVVWYKYFINRNLHKNNSLCDNLKKLFNYDNKDSKGYQPVITAFFIKAAHIGVIDISVCHYCETAYVNGFIVDKDTIKKELLYKLNHAPEGDLTTLLKLENRHQASINAIISYRIRHPFTSIEEFSNFWISKSLRPLRDIHYWKEHLDPQEELKSHFDVDHALDKGKCPLIALSLMNFVPSCQVCNRILKHSKILGDYVKRDPLPHLSPTSPDYDFDHNVRISLRFNRTDSHDVIEEMNESEDLNNCELVFDIKDKSYNWLLSIFRLRERYQFHKGEAIKWHNLKRKYDRHHIELIADAFKDIGNGDFSYEKIEEDIFQEKYDMIRRPVLKKLKSDILMDR